MKKIIFQDLSGPEEAAKQIAQYTWEKDEVAWYFCDLRMVIFKVKFTGNHCLRGNKCQREKLYEFEYVECSNPQKVDINSLKNPSQKEESTFYTTMESAMEFGIEYINTYKTMIIEKFNENLASFASFKELKELEKQTKS